MKQIKIVECCKIHFIKEPVNFLTVFFANCIVRCAGRGVRGVRRVIRYEGRRALNGLVSAGLVEG